MDAAAEIGRNAVSKDQIQPEHGDEQADAGRGCRTRLARPNSPARRGQRNIHFPCSADHEQDCGNLTRLILTLAICDDHTGEIISFVSPFAPDSWSRRTGSAVPSRVSTHAHVITSEEVR